MNNLLYKWSPAVSAIPRILAHEVVMSNMNYSEKLQWYSKVMGADWIFRLQDVVGTEEIQKNRKSWSNFYIDDIYNLHMPLDPRAPETDKMLGSSTGLKEFAFYSGMGFDGYVLALNTKRKVCRENFSIDFDDMKLDWIKKNRTIEFGNIYESDGTISKETYYRFYGEALLSIMKAMGRVNSMHDRDDDKVMNIAAAALLFLCGGHQGCSEHISNAERTEVQLDVIIISLYCRSLAKMEVMINHFPNKNSSIIEFNREQA